MKGGVLYISANQANEFLLPLHYSGRKANVSVGFGWFHDGELKAVCTFGKPASNALCDGVCGKENSGRVYELNRLCRVDDWSEPLSTFVAACLRRISTNNWIVVSYSDTAMSHHGYIYQATNFIYTGSTRERTDQFTEGKKHSRHAKEEDQTGLRKVRTKKHRYVFFATRDKRLKKQWASSLMYPVLPYPKGDNGTYKLGTYLEPTLVPDKDHA